MGNGGMQDGMMKGGMMHGMGGKRADASVCGSMTSHVEGRLAYVKAELKITADQEALWNDYASAVRTTSQSLSGTCASLMQAAAADNLPARLDAHEGFVTARLDALRTVIKAVKPLYAALSDEQKHLADQLIRGSSGMM